jgi:natural product biosynthesis luciferase-like monooxygenase protein
LPTRERRWRIKGLQMSSYHDQINNLSAEKRELLEVLLKEEGGEFNSFPLSFAQQRLWFLDQLEPGNPFYNIAFAVRLGGLLDSAAFERAFSEIIRRHEVLRTTFAAIDGEPVQIIAPLVDFGCTFIDLHDLPADKRMAEVYCLAAEEAQRAFDLSRGPLLRARLLRLSLTEHVLLLTMHHIISDAWSMGVLVREVGALYEAYTQGAESPLTQLPIQYADYAAWQREWLQGEVLERQLSYWRAQLNGAPPVLELPADHPRPVVQTFRGASQSLRLGQQLSQGVRELSRREGVTPFMTLLAAFQVLLSRYSGQRDICVGTPIANRTRVETESLIGFFVNTLVLRTDVADNPTVSELLRRVREVTLNGYAHQDLPFEKLVEELEVERSLSHTPLFQVMFSLQNAVTTDSRLAGLEMQLLEVESETARFDLALDLREQGGEFCGRAEYSTELFARETIERLMSHYAELLSGMVARADARLSEIGMMSEAERRQLLVGFNQTALTYPDETCIHQLFEQQVERTPQATALIYGAEEVSYRELNERANQLAHELAESGVGPEVRVGLMAERGVEMVVGMLGILKAGGAYVPLDPEYPTERLTWMVQDAEIKLLLTQQHLASKLPTSGINVVHLDSQVGAYQSRANLPSTAMPGNVAYVIYTSGSSGKPKGVMVSHGNVVNFFTGMDQKIGDDTPGTWLSITSIAFDISVLELFWTLTRGFAVVLHAQPEIAAAHSLAVPEEILAQRMDFSLFYFASDEGEHAENKYQLLLEGAKFADQNGFQAVWTPERHFHAFGGLYPNPSVTSAAVAAITERIQIRAGSVVLPLHNPIRVAEEWALVDNISKGRVGLSFASGWHANDFVFSPEHYAKRHEVMFEQIDTVRRLWRGEAIAVPNGTGQTIEVKTLPRPVQPELPVWVTAAGSPATFRRAGEIGANLLTHLLGQSVEELGGKIAVYRTAWREHGHGPGDGHVSLMLHTFIGEDLDYVREKVRRPFINYLMSSVGLVRNMMRSMGNDLDPEHFTEADLEQLLSQSFDRYFENSGLLGTPRQCLQMINRLKAVGVNEVACLIDFGVDVEAVMSSLRQLKTVKERSNTKAEDASVDYSLPAQIKRHKVTHLQATPSMARMLAADPATLSTLNPVQKLMLGGEELPHTLATQLKEAITGELHNMYGPTETTIWSTTHLVAETSRAIPIGRPIANTGIYILDEDLQPVPINVPGELFIGGDGVVRGYLNRPDLSAERFLPNPFANRSGARMYRTGDVARYRPSGQIEFLGRADHQVKIRGYRIELGEIETILAQFPGVRESVVVARADEQGDKRLVAYVVPEQPATETARPDDALSIGTLRNFVRENLPEYMVPAAFIVLEALPLTPNGKIDRRALPAVETVRREVAVDYVAPETEAEQTIARIWQEVLRVEKAGIHDNFFDLGGNSLLLVRVHSKLRSASKKDISLIEMFRHPTISMLAKLVSHEQKEKSAVQQAQGRAGKQLESINAQRQIVRERQQRRSDHRTAAPVPV